MEPQRTSRTRGVLASAAAATTVLAVIGMTNALSSNGNGTLITTPEPPPGPVAMRMVGYGHAAIAVPKVWGTNASRCGIPHRDTVLIDDPAAASYCDLPRPPDVDSVELGKAWTEFVEQDQALVIAGSQDVGNVRDVRAEGAQGLFEALLVADVGKDLVKHR